MLQTSDPCLSLNNFRSLFHFVVRFRNDQVLGDLGSRIKVILFPPSCLFIAIHVYAVRNGY